MLLTAGVFAALTAGVVAAAVSALPLVALCAAVGCAFAGAAVAFAAGAAGAVGAVDFAVVGLVGIAEALLAGFAVGAAVLANGDLVGVAFAELVDLAAGVPVLAVVGFAVGVEAVFAAGFVLPSAPVRLVAAGDGFAAVGVFADEEVGDFVAADFGVSFLSAINISFWAVVAIFALVLARYSRRIAF